MTMWNSFILGSDYACMCVCVRIWEHEGMCLQMPEEGFESTGAGAMGTLSHLIWFLGTENSSPLQER